MQVSDSLIVQQLSPHIPVSIASIKQRKAFGLTKKQTLSIGSYFLDRVLGNGRNGEVRLAWLPTSELAFAIKLLHRGSMNAQTVNQLEQEIRILNEIEHPHIINLREVIIDPKYVGIVMDCAQGGDVYKCLSINGAIPISQAQSWFAQLVAAVDFLHTSSFAHRDIKPENLLIDDNGNLVLTDFDMCQSFRRCGFPFTEDPCGSPTYCPPEAMLSVQPFDMCKADVWAMGITLYAMVVGYLPFDDHKYFGTSREEITNLYLHIHKTPLETPNNLEPQLTDLLHGMLAKNPTDRYSLSDIKRHPWLVNFQHLWTYPSLTDHASSSGSRRSTRFGSWASTSSLQTINDAMVQYKKYVSGPIIWDPSAGYEFPR